MLSFTRRAHVSGAGIAAVLLAVALTSPALPAHALPAHASTDTAPSTRAAVTWSDDFNGAAGSAVDTSKWQAETGGSGGGNQELEYYTAGTANTALDGDGHLVITAKKGNPGGYQCWYGTCTYTSGKITTADEFTQAYGHFEARIKLPRGAGDLARVLDAG